MLFAVVEGIVVFGVSSIELISYNYNCYVTDYRLILYMALLQTY